MKLPNVQYDSPATFNAAQRRKLRFAPPVLAYSFRTLYALNRHEVRNAHHLNDTINEKGRALLAIWHETTGILLCHHRKRNFHSTASFSFDGEMAARTVSWFGAECVRGSSSQGGSNALAQLENALHCGVTAAGLTLDGPRGPRRVAKPGLAILAARTQTWIVPNACVASRNIRLRSWDRFLIPKPFGRIIVAFAEPIPPPADTSHEAVEETRAQIELSLRGLHQELEEAVQDVQDVKDEAPH